MTPITIRYPVRPRARSLAACAVADLFGFDAERDDIVVADQVDLDLRRGDLAMLVGPSGSGKSSLLRAAAVQLGAVDVNALALPDVPLVDALTGPVPERLALLSSCGLAEARLALRTPMELSDGQRSRFRFAYALNTTKSSPLMIDEFAALLDRPLARVLAYNLRRIVSRTGIGALVATTHADVIDDLNPDVLVRCRGEGLVEVTRRDPEKKSPSVLPELWLSLGSCADWPYFARWHYRGHRLGFVTKIMVLWHHTEPVGICVFATPSAGSRQRTRFFGTHSNLHGDTLAGLTKQLWVLSRVVLHPTYRGAGVATAFVRTASAPCPVPWIEALAVMGRANPFFEKAGFVRVGVTRKEGRGLEPVYYVLDNRKS